MPSRWSFDCAEVVEPFAGTLCAPPLMSTSWPLQLSRSGLPRLLQLEQRLLLLSVVDELEGDEVPGTEGHPMMAATWSKDPFPISLFCCSASVSSWFLEYAQRCHRPRG